MSPLEEAARDVITLARRLDFYAAWCPWIESGPGGPEVQKIRRAFGEAVWRLRDRIGDHDPRRSTTP